MRFMLQLDFDASSAINEKVDAMKSYIGYMYDPLMVLQLFTAETNVPDTLPSDISMLLMW